MILDGSYEEAVEQLELALEIRPDGHEALFKLGWALSKLGEWERARVELLEAQALNPTKASIGEVLRMVEAKLEAGE